MYWKFASLAIFALFCAWVWVESKLSTRRDEKEEEKFWERERRANSTRRKPIDHLNYITIPDNLPYDVCTDNAEIQSVISTLNGLKNNKILNLTGYSNTDLKLEYGAPNITILSTADQNYTTMVTTMQKWADVLIAADHTKEAITIMEFMITTNVDIGKTYRILANHYISSGNRPAFENLITVASSLKSLNRDSIVNSLIEMNPYDN